MGTSAFQRQSSRTAQALPGTQLQTKAGVMILAVLRGAGFCAFTQELIVTQVQGIPMMSSLASPGTRHKSGRDINAGKRPIQKKKVEK